MRFFFFVCVVEWVNSGACNGERSLLSETWKANIIIFCKKAKGRHLTRSFLGECKSLWHDTEGQTAAPVEGL